MKFLLITLMALTTANSYSSSPGNRMSWACQEHLVTALGDGTLEMSTPEIIRELKTNWEGATGPFASFSYCGNSEFFIIKIEKETCSILTLEGGDSDGDCHE